MGKAKWWVCDSCKSLNDLPANKCYKCRETKPGNPTLIDDQYSEVRGSQQRVGITVDLSKVGDLTRPDPLETADGGGIMEAFEEASDPYADLDGGQSSTPRYDPYSGGYEPGPAAAQPAPPPLREPTKRSIDALGDRPWTAQPAAPEAAQPSPPPTEGAAQSEGAPSPPGVTPPPPGVTPPPPPGAVPRPPVPPPGNAPPPAGQGRPPMAPPPPSGAQGRPPVPPPPGYAPPPAGHGRPPVAPPPPPGAQGRPPVPPPLPPREASTDE